jgi:hypothetical protein
MRYLKLFNENYFDSLAFKIREEVEDFCKDYLAYLLDENFELEVTKYTDTSRDLNTIKIGIRREPEKFGTFKWDEVKDQVIPFLQVLKERYTLDKPLKKDNIPFHKRSDIILYTEGFKQLAFETKGLIDEQDKSLENLKLRAIVLYVKLEE